MGRRGESIYHRKDGLWEARYVKGVDISGKKRYSSVYGHTYREAKQKRQEALDNALLCPKPVPLRQLTVADLAEEWMKVNADRLKPSTIQRYRGCLKNHINPILGSSAVTQLTTVTIHQLAQDRLTAGLTAQSVNALLTLLHSILKYGYRQYRLPMPDIIYLSCERKEMRVLSIQEQRKLTNYLMQDLDMWKLGVLVALYTGLRIGELCALSWEDVQQDRIYVRRTVQRLKKDDNTGTSLFIGTPKTKTSNRIIPIPAFLGELISNFRGWNQADMYFLTQSAQRIPEPRVMQYRFQCYQREAGIDKASFHALRHTFATRCVEAGFEIKSLSEVLGHSNVQTTLNKYVHSSFDLKKANMDLLSINL